MLPRLIAVLILLLATLPSVAAESTAQLPGLIRETMRVQLAERGLSLEALVTRPAAPGRHPLLVLSHGAPRDAAQRPTMRPQSSGLVAIEFARRGYAVVAVMRRGYGQSDGPYAESNGACKTPDYPASARASGQDILDSIKALASQPWVDPGTVVLVGQSAGGFASMAAAAAQPANLKAVINLAGGRGSTGPDEVCRSDLLAQTFGSFGRTVRVPTIWLYSQNDHYFGPSVARSFFDAFKTTGGNGEFVALPAFGEDGHLLTSAEGMTHWRAAVDDFLRRNKLPTWSAPVTEKLASLPTPKQLSGSGRERFESYLALTSFEKAFAVAGNGGYGWASGHRTTDDAARAAMENCEKRNQGCKVYALNNMLAP